MMDVLAALKVLADTPPNALKAYQGNQYYAAVSRKFGAPRLQIGSAESVLRKIGTSLPDVEQYLTGEPARAVGELPLANQDPRLTDVEAVYKELPSDGAKFRAYLGLGSLTDQYDHWEWDTHHTSRIGRLVANPSKLNSQKARHVSDFVKHMGYSSKTAYKAVMRGIRLRVLERLYGCCGISAVLSFRPSVFDSLKYEDFRAFISLVKDGGDSTGTKLMQLAQSVTNFVEKCQTVYHRKSTS